MRGDNSTNCLCLHSSDKTESLVYERFTLEKGDQGIRPRQVIDRCYMSWYVLPLKEDPSTFKEDAGDSD